MFLNSAIFLKSKEAMLLRWCKACLLLFANAVYLKFIVLKIPLPEDKTWFVIPLSLIANKRELG